MDQSTNKIKDHIDSERELLGRNLDEIEDRVKEATSIKAQFDNRTGWFLGAAAAGGFLLSLALTKSSPGREPRRPAEAGRTDSLFSHEQSPLSRHWNRVSDTLDTIAAGLVGVVSDKLSTYVADAVPGFREQYDAVDRQKLRSAG